MSNNDQLNYISNHNLGDDFQYPLENQSVDELGHVFISDLNFVLDPKPFLVSEASEMTKAKPDFRTDDKNLVVLTTNGKTLFHSSKLAKYFAQRGGVFEIRINHGLLNPAEFVRLFVNHTQERIITSVVKTCDKPEHLAFQKPGMEFILSFVDHPTQSPKIEYIKDPFTGKLSVKVFPVSGSEVTYLKLRFNCLNGCLERKQDMQWNLLVSKETSYSSNLQVVSRASIDIKAAEKPSSELVREEKQAMKKEMGLPGRGRKRKSDEQTVYLLLDTTQALEAPENPPLELPEFQTVSTLENSEPSQEGVVFQMFSQDSGEPIFIQTLPSMEETVTVQQLVDPHLQEVVVSETSTCSFAPNYVDENTPRDVLEEEYLELKPHFSDEELVEIINAKKYKLSIQNV